MEQRKDYLDFLKGVAIFAVIVIHVSTEGFYRELSLSNVIICTTVYSLARFSVPVFLMTTGVVFLEPNKQLTIKRIFSKYILNIIIAAFIWGAIYKVINVFLNGGFNGIFNVIKAYIKEFCTADLEFHFWYVYALIGIYLALPILRAFVKGADRRTIEYFLLVWAIFNMLFIIVQGGYFEFLNNLSNNFRFIGLFIGYIGYPVLGYYLNTYEQKKVNKIVLTVGAVVVFCLGLSFTIYDKITLGDIRVEYMSYLSPVVVLYAIVIFLLVKNKKIYSGFFSKVFKRIGKQTLGIYFMHMTFVILFFRTGLIPIGILFSCSPIDILVYSITILLVSWVIQELLSKIPYVGKWL